MYIRKERDGIIYNFIRIIIYIIVLYYVCKKKKIDCGSCRSERERERNNAEKTPVIDRDGRITKTAPKLVFLYILFLFVVFKK